jgi:hypothetical protein
MQCDYIQICFSYDPAQFDNEIYLRPRTFNIQGNIRLATQVSREEEQQYLEKDVQKDEEQAQESY